MKMYGVPLQCLVTSEDHYIIWAILKMVFPIKADAWYKPLKNMIYLSKKVLASEDEFTIQHNSDLKPYLTSLLINVP